MATRRKKAKSIGEAVSKGIREMDTEDVVGLLLGVVGSAVFFKFATVSVAGTDLSTSIGYSIAGAPISYAVVGAVGGSLWQLATNQLRGSSDGINFDAMEKWGALLSLGPTVAVWWNQEAMNYVTGDYAIAGVAVLIASAGYIMLAAAPRVMYRRN
jgi:hypothetical protein